MARVVSAEISGGVAFEVVTLLPGFTSLTKRSGELDGNLPVRAARYCGPVFEGSAAGFQITLAQPMTVARAAAVKAGRATAGGGVGRSGATRAGKGPLTCDMTPPALHQVTEDVNDALERGIRERLLERGGYWHRLFLGDAMPIRGNRLLVWTGHMVRPRSDLWLLVGGAFNRRSRVSVIDHVVSDPGRFVPLVVEIDGRDVTDQPRWMEGELGCVTPVSPSVRMRKEPLRAGAPELRQFGEFFSEEYFQTKAAHPTATYVRRQRDHRVKATEACDARLLYVGPDVHEIRALDRFITADGFASAAASPGQVEFAVVRNIAPTRWVWQGQTHSVFEVRKDKHQPALETLWRETFGDTRPSGLEFLRGYMMGEHWDQPYVQLQPWVFVSTPLGWSSLVDGVHRAPDYDGMRAVIATDWFHALAMVYRLFGPSEVRIPMRAPMLRALPVRRSVLDLDLKYSVLD
jgi:hypothetical protein